MPSEALIIRVVVSILSTRNKHFSYVIEYDAYHFIIHEVIPAQLLEGFVALLDSLEHIDWSSSRTLKLGVFDEVGDPGCKGLPLGLIHLYSFMSKHLIYLLQR